MAAPRSDELVALGRSAGLVAVGVASAEPFDDVRRILEERRAAGLHAGMQFTYRNPARSTDPRGVVPGARSLVVGALAYPPPGPGAGPSAGTASGRVAAYAVGDHYGALRHALGVVADRLRAAGATARVVADDNALVDRAAAHRAGLGWWGKNANLLVPGAGSWVVLGTVVTDAALEPTPAPVPDGCGACARCLDGCPTGAIVAPGVVDARRCLAWLVQAEGTFPRQHRVALGDRLYGCDDCQEVCPPNRRAARSADGAATTVPAAGPPHDPDDEHGFVDLVALLDASDEEVLARHGRWYVPRRDPAYLRRNALIVLANTAPAPPDARIVACLGRCLAHESPMVRAHAVWAARRLGVPALCAAVRGDPDATVQEELAAVVPGRAGSLVTVEPAPGDASP